MRVYLVAKRQHTQDIPKVDCSFSDKSPTYIYIQVRCSPSRPVPCTPHLCSPTAKSMLNNPTRVSRCAGVVAPRNDGEIQMERVRTNKVIERFSNIGSPTRTTAVSSCADIPASHDYKQCQHTQLARRLRTAPSPALRLWTGMR